VCVNSTNLGYTYLRAKKESRISNYSLKVGQIIQGRKGKGLHGEGVEKVVEK